MPAVILKNIHYTLGGRPFSKDEYDDPNIPALLQRAHEAVKGQGVDRPVGVVDRQSLTTGSFHAITSRVVTVGSQGMSGDSSGLPLESMC